MLDRRYEISFKEYLQTSLLEMTNLPSYLTTATDIALMEEN
jgi:hypothetical protein